MASRLVARFGLETLDVIENQPERLTEVEGIGPKRQPRDPARLDRAAGDQGGDGLPAVARRLHPLRDQDLQALRRAADDAGRENPYRLATDIYGIGFKTRRQDRRGPGHPADAPAAYRGRASSTCWPRARTAGHVFLPAPDPDGGWRRSCSARRPGRGRARPIAALAGGGAGGGRARSSRRPRDPGEAAVYLKSLHVAERGVGGRFTALLASRRCRCEIDVERALDWFEKRERIALAREQRAGHPLRADPQGAGHHRRPRHRQDDAGARHRRDPGEEAAEGAARGAHRPRRQAPGRGHRRARPRRSTGCSSSTRRPGLRPQPRAPARLRPADRRRGVDARHGARLPPAQGRAGPRPRWSWWATWTSCPRSGPAGCSPTSSAPSAVRGGAPDRDLPPGRAQPDRGQRPPGATRGEMPILESADSDGDFFFIEREEPEEIAGDDRRARRRAHPGAASASTRSSRSRC